MPFARNESGIDLPGNARDWWDNASGLYARGSMPQIGAVLAFKANPRMHLGHVAVVTRLINRREIEVDQANWSVRGGVTRGVAIVDISENNDWSAVRVELARDDGQFGAVYPAHGFIYNRLDNGTLVASAAPPAPTPVLNPAPADLRDPADRDFEVAEAPESDAPTAHPQYRLRHVYRVTSHHHSARQTHKVSG